MTGRAAGASPAVQLDEERLRVAAEPVRAAILRALAAEQMCTCHLVELLEVRQTNVSNHLRVLREAGLVEAEPVGRYTYYRLRPDALHALAGQLAGLAETATATMTQGRRRPC
ncbi:MAG: helix-turn-helix domain-containing protein [Actinomycetota bacterium]|nr:helix-turn-helix domain-containing protein [Actinomycetota bacterium]